MFSGDRVEEFQVEILGVLENVGPKQSLILARLSGGPLERTGVMQGMSGSPVYIDGRLVGAVAMAFQFSKEPITAIRPIEEMLRNPQPVPARTSAAPRDLSVQDLTRGIAKRTEVAAGESRLVDIATPIAFSGFTRNTVEHFAPQLRAMGLEPLQGITGGGTPAVPKMGDISKVKPGSMITVQLMTGDLAIGADGTVTHIEGRKIYAFGHRFLSVGDTEMPFARAEVLALMPNVSTSFKISASREWMGSMTQDRSTAVSGELGRLCDMATATIRVERAASGLPASVYKMQLIQDRTLTPFLLQMAVFSAIDATERTLGASSFSMNGTIEFDGGTPPIRLQNMYTGDFNVPVQVSMGAAVPLSFALQSGFDALKVRSISLDVAAFDTKKQAQIDQVLVSRQVARPGESIDVIVSLNGENGVDIERKATYKVPVGASPGPLYFTAADGNTTNIMEYRNMLVTQPRSIGQLISFLNGLRPNTKAYVRVWRPDPNFQVEGEDLPNPPASVALLLGKAQAATGASPSMRNAKVAELELNVGDLVVSGSKTVQVDIKE